MIAKAGQDLTLGQALIRRLKSISTLCVGTTLIMMTIAGPALAQPATCDPAYWNSLKARAWTEAQREIEQNQNMIYKADSVLEYSCFDQFLNVLTANAPNLFSETTRWGVIPGPNMQNALQIMVGDSLGTYIANNFPHDYLGEYSTLNYTPSAVSNNANYDCDQMRNVWVAAKCQDFVNASTAQGKANTSAADDFFYLDTATYGTTDYRQYPAGSACTIAGNWANQLSLAKNDANQYAREPFNVYANFFNSTACGAGAPPIPTGITVKRPSVPDYAEAVCVNPGCAFNRTAGTCAAAPAP